MHQEWKRQPQSCFACTPSILWHQMGSSLTFYEFSEHRSFIECIPTNLRWTSSGSWLWFHSLASSSQCCWSSADSESKTSVKARQYLPKSFSVPPDRCIWTSDTMSVWILPQTLFAFQDLTEVGWPHFSALERFVGFSVAYPPASFPNHVWIAYQSQIHVCTDGEWIIPSWGHWVTCQ